MTEAPAKQARSGVDAKKKGSSCVTLQENRTQEGSARVEGHHSQGGSDVGGFHLHVSMAHFNLALCPRESGAFSNCSLTFFVLHCYSWQPQP